MRSNFQAVRIYQILAATFNELGWIAAHAEKEGEPLLLLQHVAQNAALITEKMGFTHLLPTGIFPVGTMGAKGFGSPYSVSDCRSLVPSVGSWDDVQLLAANGLPMLVDFIPNHTAWEVAQEKPELFLRCDCSGSALCECRESIASGGYWHDEPRKEIAERRRWTDVAQLDLSSEAVWHWHRETIDFYRKMGVGGVRMDSADHVLSTAFERTWGVRPAENFLADLVTTNHDDFLWLAECYSASANRELSRLGCVTYDTPENERGLAWRDALAERDPVVIQRAIRRATARFNDESRPMPWIDCGTHDHPSPGWRYGSFLPAALGLTLLAPTPVIHLGGNECGFDAWPHGLPEERALLERELVCRPQPLSLRRPINWNGEWATAVYRNVFDHCRQTVNRLQGNVAWDGTITDGSNGWNGYRVVNDDASYLVAANFTNNTVNARPYGIIEPGQYLVLDDAGQLAALTRMIRSRGVKNAKALKDPETQQITLHGVAGSYSQKQVAQEAFRVYWPLDNQIEVCS